MWRTRSRYSARNLDVPDGKFEAVLAHTLVSHVQDALRVLKEAGRVTQPGGLIAIFVEITHR
jgi:ubiquinone/menaquinone biosynthesis C-methylase UbiE